jgi:hypothetical protein
MLYGGQHVLAGEGDMLILAGWTGLSIGFVLGALWSWVMQGNEA